MNLTHAMILAAGLGTRMRPLTLSKPKPLIEVGGRALIDWSLDFLNSGGIEHVVINTSYLAEQLEAHLAARAHPRITLSREGEPALETGGGVANALPHLGGGVFLTMNADALFIPPPIGGRLGGGLLRNGDSNNQAPLPSFPRWGEGIHPIAALQNAWNDDLDFLMLLVSRDRAHGRTGNGDFVIQKNHSPPEGESERTSDPVGGYLFRRPHANEVADYVFTGVELMHPRVFDNHPPGAFSLGTLWNARAGEGGWFSRMRAVIFEGDWLDVGDLNALKTAAEFLVRSLPLPSGEV